MALLFPIDWPEPFGLVMIEAMASATPVLGFRRGAVPEIVDHGLTGFAVDDIAGAFAMLPRAIAFDRMRIRRRFEERFSVERMASDYTALYREVLSRGAASARVLASTADQPARDAA
jgi:glycosyltransferase involved in cell wall biosynthesis